MRVFLGIDTGTSILKGHVVDENGRSVAYASRAREQTDAKAATRTTTPGIWWDEWCRICNELISQLPASAEIACVASTAMVPNVCLLDSSGESVGPTILFYDDRAYDIERGLDMELGTDRWQNEVLSKLMWYCREIGPLPHDGLTFTTTHSYITLKLTGKTSLDTVTAAETGSIYVPGIGWNGELLRRFELGDLSMPEVVAPVSVVGSVTPEAAAATGLAEGTPVVAGTADSVASLIGAGARHKGDTLIYYGTFNCAARLDANISDVLSGEHRPYPIDWLTSVPRAGHQIRDVAKMLFPGDSPYRDFDSAADASPAGANGLIFLQDVDLLNTTVSSSPRGALLNLQIGHTAADIARAVLESFAYALAVTLEISGVPSGELLAGGGGARSQEWRQIVTDVLGLPQRYLRHSDRGHGSALLALAGVDSDAFETVTDNLLREADVVRPSGRGPLYASSLAHYREALGRLPEVHTW
ncbi:FGGY family carbohydrate kinase [Streptomyces sp. NPDC001288]|uniref:FGGY family carbohydrate kinase n=1 Tax=unclassified Streptomyces TaxID=2593676 RepID=UPI0033190943